MPSFRRMQYILYLKRAGIVFLFLIVAAALYFGLQTDAWKSFSSRWKFESNQEEPEEVDPEAPIDVDQFEKFLSISSTQQLILRSTELVDIPTENPVVRLDLQHKKIRIADQLMSQHDDSRAILFGTKSKLSALRQRELINFDQGLTSQESLSELNSFAKTFTLTGDADILLEARLGELLAGLIEQLLKSGSSDFSISDDVLKNFESVCNHYPNELEVASEMFGYLERVYVHGSTADHEKFVNAFQSSYLKSEDENLRAMAQEVDKKLVDAEFELVNIFDSIDSLQAETADKLRGQIIKALDLPNVSRHGFSRILNGIRDIASIGKYEAAGELCELLHARISNKPNLERLAEANSKLRTQLQLAGKPLDMTSIKNMDGTQFAFRFPDADVKAMVFFTGDSFAKSDRYLFDVMRIAGRFIANNRFCLTTVFVDPGNTAALNEINRVARLVPAIDFCRLDEKSEEGQQLLQKLAIENPPMLLLFDKNDNVQGINIAREDFEKRFFESLGD